VSKRQKTLNKLSEIIRPYGLTIIDGDHRKIVKENGQQVYSMSSTPSCEFFAERSLRDLIRMGLVPNSARQKIR
jgi:type IV secretory pathway ATPase VirB11/archaellum biosynthesis ATPase